MKDTLFSIKKTLNIRGKLLSLDEPQVMGIINVTPDSFFPKSRIQVHSQILNTVEKMVHEGAAFIDIGGYSSRPGADDIPIDEEIARVVPPIRDVNRLFPDMVVSVDTFRAEVALKAIEAGAGLVNDISGGLLDPDMIETVARLRVPYMLMHMRGDPQTMKTLATYNNLFKEIAVYYNRRIKVLNEAGIADIIIDPGFGFAKTIDQNFELLKNLSYFNMFELPLLAGLSRKSMIYRTLNTDPEEALNGTSILNTLAVLNKASILRVHDVRQAREVIQLMKKAGL